MREICTSGSTRGGHLRVPSYSTGSHRSHDREEMVLPACAGHAQGGQSPARRAGPAQGGNMKAGGPEVRPPF